MPKDRAKDPNRVIIINPGPARKDWYQGYQTMSESFRAKHEGRSEEDQIEDSFNRADQEMGK